MTATTRVGYGYDHLSRLASVTEEKRLGQTLATPKATVYRYDLLGRLDEQVNANDTLVDYVYDTMNRVASIKHHLDSDHTGEPGMDPVIAQFDYTYLADGNRESATESFNTPWAIARMTSTTSSIGRSLSTAPWSPCGRAGMCHTHADYTTPGGDAGQTRWHLRCG